MGSMWSFVVRMLQVVGLPAGKIEQEYSNSATENSGMNIKPESSSQTVTNKVKSVTKVTSRQSEEQKLSSTDNGCREDLCDLQTTDIETSATCVTRSSAAGIVDTCTETTQLTVTTAKQDVSPSKDQNNTTFENCTIINKNYYSGHATSQLENDGTLPLLHHSSSEVIKRADDDEYKYLDNDVMICRQPLRKGTKVFQGRQLHCGPDEVGIDTSRDVAVKILHSSKNSAKEVDFLIKLTEHQNIVRILQSGKYPGPTDEIYIVMELCSKNLQEYVDENRLKRFSFRKTTALAKQFVCGLQFIHDSKIVHGDLKPDNILFSMSENYLKISDFGMSKYVHSSHSRSSVSGVGTDGYRAPELYHEGTKASYESDMFSFGIITFFLFTNGKHPYGEDANDWSYNIRRNTESPDLSEIANIVSTSIPGKHLLHTLLQHTLSSSPAARPTIDGNVGDAGRLRRFLRHRYRHDPDMDDISHYVNGRITVSRRSQLYISVKRHSSAPDPTHSDGL